VGMAKEVGRGTAPQRGYDHRWRKLRNAKLAYDPLCEVCMAMGYTEPAQDVDHIQPFDGKHDPKRLEWANLQSICRECHARKTAGERIGKAYPEWMPKPSIPVTVVCGPPLAGKTTYAHEHASDGDEVIDLDAIGQELSGDTGHAWDRRWLGAAIHERNRRIARWGKRRKGQGWLIVSAPRKEQREWWQDTLGAELVLLVPSLNECMKRANQQGRPASAVSDWFAEYRRRSPHKRMRAQVGTDGYPIGS